MKLVRLAGGAVSDADVIIPEQAPRAAPLELRDMGVPVCHAGGTIAERIDVPEPWTANVSSGGADHKTHVITASTGLYAVRLRVGGTNAAK